MRKTLLIILTLTTLSAQDAFSSDRCKNPDRSFDEFLSSFRDNIDFQRTRLILPIVYRFGDYRMGDPKIELWDRKRILGLKNPLILPKSKMGEFGIEQTIPVRTKWYVQVFDSRHMADSYRITFNFTNVDGCWYLEELHETSL